MIADSKLPAVLAYLDSLSDEDAAAIRSACPQRRRCEQTWMRAREESTAPIEVNGRRTLGH